MKYNLRYKTIQQFYSQGNGKNNEKNPKNLTILGKNDTKRQFMTPNPLKKRYQSQQSPKSIMTNSKYSNMKHNQDSKNKLQRILNYDVDNQEDISLMPLGIQSTIQKQNQQKRVKTKTNCKTQNIQSQQQFVVTREFVKDFDKQKVHKDQLYQTLREKFVQKYPQKRKLYQGKYKQIDLIIPDLIQPNDNSSIRKSKCSSSDFYQEKSWIRMTILAHLKQIPERKQNQYKKEVAKKSHFYSKSKGRCLTSFFPYQQIQEQSKIKQISQFNFLSYQKNRKPFRKYNNNKFKESNHIQKASKVRRLLKNQFQILNIEKQGSHQYDILKKSYQQCIQRQQN